MSAYVVEDKVINQIVDALACARLRENVLTETGCNLAVTEDRAKLGQSMFELNCTAVEQRYGKGEAASFRTLDYTYQRSMPPTLIQAYKSLGCWMYQCSEGDVPETPLFKTMEKLHGEMAHEIVRQLPAYDRAAW